MTSPSNTKLDPHGPAHRALAGEGSVRGVQSVESYAPLALTHGFRPRVGSYTKSVSNGAASGPIKIQPITTTVCGSNNLTEKNYMKLHSQNDSPLSIALSTTVEKAAATLEPLTVNAADVEPHSNSNSEAEHTSKQKSNMNTNTNAIETNEQTQVNKSSVGPTSNVNNLLSCAKTEGEILERYLNYKRGKLRTHQLCAQLGECETQLSMTIMPGREASSWVKIRLYLEGYHILKSDISLLLDYYRRDFFEGSEQEKRQLLFAKVSEEWEIERIPNLLRLHQHFAELVAVSPLHPFDVEPDDFRSHVFGASLLALVDENKCVTFDEGKEECNLSSIIAPVSVWPFPLKDEAAFEDECDNFRTDSLVRHWNYCCFECIVKDSIGSLVDAIKDGSLRLIWAAARNEKKLDLMFLVDADDRQSWERARRAVVAQLANLGLSVVPIAFHENIAIPGTPVASYLMYFNPDHCKEDSEDIKE